MKTPIIAIITAMTLCAGSAASFATESADFYKVTKVELEQYNEPLTAAELARFQALEQEQLDQQIPVMHAILPNEPSLPAKPEAKPAKPEAKPATGDAKPATGDAKPAAGDAKPATGDAKPAANDTTKPAAADNTDSPNPGFAWDKVILVGEKIIQFITNNKPTVNLKRDVVAALPEGVTAWDATAGWQMPLGYRVDVTLSNIFGIKLAKSSMKIIATYGGSFNGKGKYLKNVTVVPLEISAYVGHKVDVWTEFRDPVNMGTVAEPIAQLGFDIRYRSTNMLNDKLKAVDVVVTGDGRVQADVATK